MLTRFLVICLLAPQLFFAKNVTVNGDTLPAQKKNRKLVFSIGAGVMAGSSLVGLNQAWYKPYATGSFHFFNDNGEWLQMDKAGHVFTTFNTGRLMTEGMQNAGFTKKQSIFIGGTSGLAYMTAIEIMDGFSSGYGFSWGDMAANVTGSAAAVAQELIWNEQRISFKYSFHQTSFAQYRPNLLGTNLTEQMLKDYNGQTYWASVNIASFLKKETRFPKWLNVAFGYGATGMISGTDNFVLVKESTVVGNERYRRFLLSLDVDLTKIKVRSRFLRSVFSAFNCVKIPFPAIELTNGVFKGYLVYF